MATSSLPIPHDLLRPSHYVPFLEPGQGQGLCDGLHSRRMAKAAGARCLRRLGHKGDILRLGSFSPDIWFGTQPLCCGGAKAAKLPADSLPQPAGHASVSSWR